MDRKTAVLYVDDEESLRLLVQTQLTTEGYHIETADDGDTAVQMLAKKKFDVVLLDVRMPRMNGIDVLKYIKKEKIMSRTIMLTGVDDLSVALESVKNGASDYLTKPFDYRVLIDAIERVVAK